MSEDVRCPKCGGRMERWADWTLHRVRTVEYLCPSCLHVERVELRRRSE